MYGDELPIDLAMTDIIEGIEFLHAHGIVYGDIKPSNLLVNCDREDEFEFKLTDYASIPLSMQQSSHSTTLKQLMTPGYMAPELYSSSFDSLPVQQSNASDIYAFAILSYELICSRPAWQNISMCLLDCVHSGFRPAFPQGVVLEELIKECWNENPDLRPTASTVLEALNNFSHLDVSVDSFQQDSESVDHCQELAVDASLPTHRESSSSQPCNSLQLLEPLLESQQFKVFKSTDSNDIPSNAFCTTKYLFRSDSMGLCAIGPYMCHVAYIYPKNVEQDGRRWFIALNSGSSDGIHNHPPPSKWKVLPKVLSDI